MAAAKGVPIRIGDGTKKRQLRFDTRALERLQEETACGSWPDGMPLAILAQQIDLMSIKVVNTAIWVGLLHAEPELERGEVVDMIDSRKLDVLCEALGKALEAALPQGDAAEDDEEGKAG